MVKAKMNTKNIFFVAHLILLLGVSWPTAAAADGPMAETDELTFGVEDFRDGSHQDVVVTAEGLTLAEGFTTGHYLSPILTAPLAYNAVVPEWWVDQPEGSSLTIIVRTGSANGRWSEWQIVAENDDWMTENDDRLIGQMFTVPGVDGTHTQIQYGVSFSRYAGQPAAVLRDLRLVFIDSTDGPTAEELIDQQKALDGPQPRSTTSGYPKPFVISRDVWCTDPRCDYSEGLSYRTVTHLIVHHTVSSNSSTNWASVVRAIWSYHYTRDCPDNCWGDIGYNYLVDMNGVLYEGHLGGDDVIGTHAGGANAGSMALAFIGTFTTPSQNPPGIAPPSAMKNSAAELFAWKADQRGIDVFGSGYLPYINWILPKLMGHRDVYGTTACPGDQAYALLPWLRTEVTNRIASGATYLYVSEQSGDFVKSPTDYWYVPPNNCGYGGHAFYTWSVTNPASSTNWGEWRPNVPASDYYEVEAFIPYCITGKAETDGATYKITHGLGTSQVVVSHETYVGGWAPIGTFYFNAGKTGVIRLTDLTTTDSGLGVWFDDIRLRRANLPPPPTAANQQPAQNTWQMQRNVTFNWTVANGGSVSQTRLEVSSKSDFSSLILSKEWAGAPTSYAHTFGQDYARLYWRIKLTVNQGGTVTSNSTYFGLDSEPPTSLVQKVIRMEDGRYVLSLYGSDSASGVASYNLDYREEGSSWVKWLTGLKGTTASFSGDPARHYEFRSQAVDVVGHIEPLHSTPDASTRNAVQVKRVIIFPIIRHYTN